MLVKYPRRCDIVIGKLGLSAVAEQGTDHRRGSLLGKFIRDDPAVRAVYQYIVQLEFLCDTHRREDIVRAVAVEMRLELVLLIE